MDGAIIVGNSTADAGAFSSTGLIDIQDDLETGSSILIKEQCQGDIEIAGSVEGTITADQQFENGATINIGHSVVSGATIHCKAPTSPLAAQIFINSVNAGTPGTWSGAIKYGSGSGTTISHTGGVYSTASATLGGGAIGVVGFKVYDTECDPLPTNYVGGTSDSDVEIAFFGPVTWASGFPFIVEWYNGSSWTDESGDWAVVSGQGTRHVVIEYDGGTPIPGERDYRVRPVTSGSNALVCDGTLAYQPPTNNFTYLFNTYTSR